MDGGEEGEFEREADVGLNMGGVGVGGAVAAVQG